VADAGSVTVKVPRPCGVMTSDVGVTADTFAKRENSKSYSTFPVSPPDCGVANTAVHVPGMGFVTSVWL
jgi:hypothetical protein